MLYGIFVPRLLQERSPHYYDAQKICHNYWQPVLSRLQWLNRNNADTSSS